MVLIQFGHNLFVDSKLVRMPRANLLILPIAMVVRVECRKVSCERQQVLSLLRKNGSVFIVCCCEDNECIPQKRIDSVSKDHL